jgi:site-specific DNA-adenine methylase
MRYGMPYMGSKNTIADDIVNILPKANNLYDLFCGGCAITHCAILKSKYKHYYINDLQPKHQLKLWETLPR